MPDLLTPEKTERGWIIAMSPEMANEAGVAVGSILIVYLGRDGVTAEILPPATDEIKQSVQHSIRKFDEVFAELKQLGD